MMPAVSSCLRKPASAAPLRPAEHASPPPPPPTCSQADPPPLLRKLMLPRQQQQPGALSACTQQWRTVGDQRHSSGAHSGGAHSSGALLETSGTAGANSWCSATCVGEQVRAGKFADLGTAIRACLHPVGMAGKGTLASAEEAARAAGLARRPKTHSLGRTA